MEVKKISFVLPALNEEKAIESVLNEFPADKLSEKGYEFEIIVVDGGSLDKTVAIARSKGVKVIFSSPGYGRQYLKGFEEASGDIIATADSDGSYMVSDIADIVTLIEDGKYKFVTVNRFSCLLPGSMPVINYIGNVVLTFFVNLFFGIEIKDSQSGMWVFDKKILDELSLSGKGMNLSEEIKIRAFKKVESIEIGGTYRPRKGRTKLCLFKDGLINLLYIIKLKLTI